MLCEETITAVKRELSKSLHVNLSLCDNNGKSCTRTTLQSLLDTKLAKRDQNLTYQTVLSHALRAEGLFPGFGIELLRRFVGENRCNSFKTFNKKSDLKEKLKSLDLRQRDISLLLSVAELSSAYGKVSIKRSRDLTSFIEVTSGYLFYLKCLTSDAISLDRPIIACIDGYVESVSEIHMLLENLSQSKQPCVIFLRGCHEDVIHTVKVNNKRGSLNVHLVVVPFDVESSNTLVDVSVIAAGDVVSSLKGDLISTIDASKLASIESIEIDRNRVSISNPSTQIAVESHVSHLIKKIEDRPELEEILSKRIRSLSSKKIDIYLPNDSGFSSTCQKFDEALRWISLTRSSPVPPILALDDIEKSMISILKDMTIV